MRRVYKHLSGHVVGARPNSNGPIRAKIERGIVPRVTVRTETFYVTVNHT